MAMGALNSFETLEFNDAADNARDALKDIIEYIDALDRADNSVPISVVRETNAGIRIVGVGAYT